MDHATQTVVEFILERFAGLVPEEITKDSLLKDELGIDSLRIVELLVGLEEKLNITFDESDLNPDALVTVGDVSNLLQKYERVR